MSDEVIEFEWDPRPADWAGALRAVVPAYRWSPWFAGVLAIFAAGVWLTGNPWAGGFGLGAALVIALLPSLQVRMTFSRNPVAHRRVTAQADSRSLRLMTVDGTAHSDLAWTQLPAWLETAHAMVLREGEHPGSPLHPIPVRAFATHEQRDRFRELLISQLGEPSAKPKPFSLPTREKPPAAE